MNQQRNGEKYPSRGYKLQISAAGGRERRVPFSCSFFWANKRRRIIKNFGPPDTVTGTTHSYLYSPQTTKSVFKKRVLLKGKLLFILCLLLTGCSRLIVIQAYTYLIKYFLLRRLFL